MDEFNEELAKKIVQFISSKSPNLKCPVCAHDNFSILGGINSYDLQNDLHSRVIGGKTVPTAVLACLNCGYIFNFSLGVMGLLDDMDKDHGRAKK